MHGLKLIITVVAGALMVPAAAIAAQATLPAVPVPGKAASDYVVGPGDQLQVFVWRNPELSVNVPVRPDGKISTPLVDDMVAAGKSPSALARDLEKVLGEYIRTPTVNVIVTTAASASSQVRVVGQAVNPRAIPYREGLTVLDVVIEVGGLGQFAAGNRAQIVRKGSNGNSQVVRLKLHNLVNDGDLRQNVAMQPGDVLIIPESRF